MSNRKDRTRRWSQGALAAAGVLVLTSAGWAQQDPKSAPAGETRPGSPAQPGGKKDGEMPALPQEIINRNHLLGPGDVIDVQVPGFTDLSRRVKLFTDGTFELPLVGTIEAGGLTKYELEGKLLERLGTILKRPRVRVEIVSVFVPPPPPAMPVPRIQVFGPVDRRGAVDWPTPLPLRNLLVMVGYRETTDLSKIRIKYPDGRSRTADFGQFESTGMSKDDFILNGGEEVYFFPRPTAPPPQPVRYEILGAIANQGAFSGEGRMGIWEAIKKAGGAGPLADLERVEVTGPNHKTPHFVNVLAYSLGNTEANYFLQDGDVVRIHEKKERVLVVGEVAKQGEHGLREGETLDQLLIRIGFGPNADQGKVELVRKGPDGKQLRRSYNVQDMLRDKKPPEKLAAGDVVFVPNKKQRRSFLQYLGEIASPIWLLRGIGLGGI